jgi:hypothetical protein
MVFGILASVSAPVEVTMVSSSTVTPGREEASDPVAMTMFFAVWRSSPTLTWPAAGMVAQPFSQVILFFLNRNSIPLVLPLTTSSL